MKTFLRFFVALLLALGIIAVGQTFPAGFPSGSSSSSSSGDGYWVDAGTGWTARVAPITHQLDGGPALAFRYPGSTGYGFNVTMDTSQGNWFETNWPYYGGGSDPGFGGFNFVTSGVRIFSRNNGAGATGFAAGRQLLSLRNDQTGSAIGTGLTMFNSAGAELGSLFYAPQYLGTGTESLGLSTFWNVPIAFYVNPSNVQSTTPSGTVSAGGTFTSYAASNANAFAVTVNGARYDLGTGSSDYAVSDGTGIKTPSYWESTRAFASGAGVIAARARLAGSTNDAFTAAAAATSGAGDLSYDTTFKQMMMQNSASAFAPVGAHNTYGRQVISTRLMGVNGSLAYPEISERIRTDASGSLLQVYIATTGSATGLGVSPVSGLNRTYYVISTGTTDNSEYAVTVASSGSPSTMQPIVAVPQQPSWCQNIRTAGSIAVMRIWAGLASSAPSGSDLTGNGVMFRYDTNVSGNWYLCARDGTTQKCHDLGLAVATNTAYHLCVGIDSSLNYYAWINGTSYLTSAENAPLNTASLAPWLSLRTLNGSVKAIYQGIYQVESY